MTKFVLALTLFAIASISSINAGRRTKREPCLVNVIPGYFYIHGPITVNGSFAFTAANRGICIEACKQNEHCHFFNYAEKDKKCYLLKEGLKTAANADPKRFDIMSQSVHGYVDCGVAPPQASTTCGRQAPGFQPLIAAKRIINGNEAIPNSWPWLLFLNVRIAEGATGNCGASLVQVGNNAKSSDIVITAAHCVATKANKKVTVYGPEEFTVIAGRHSRKMKLKTEQSRKVTAVRAHPGYVLNSLANDIAILKLESPIVFDDRIRPICLPTPGESIPVGQTCMAAGWGRINTSDRQTADAVQQTELPALDAATCKTAASGYGESSMICAGAIGSQAVSTVCNGDSGGMFACRANKDAPWVLQGIPSFVSSTTCLSEKKPATFTRVSSYIDFVLTNAAEMTSLH